MLSQFFEQLNRSVTEKIESNNNRPSSKRSWKTITGVTSSAIIYEAVVPNLNTTLTKRQGQMFGEGELSN